MNRLLQVIARAPDHALSLDRAAAGEDHHADGRLTRQVSTLRLATGIVVGGRFRLERRLGEGGMGVVWQATHVVTRKPVALKFLKQSDDGDRRPVQRFLREARAACAVRHPCVVEVHDVLELDDGSPVMVMELLTGETLADRLARVPTHAMPLADFARVIVHVCSAVACAHALGIVHRDLKPDNIFLATARDGIAVKVLDFGIAKLTATEGDAANTGAKTGTGALLGTPFYMAPEQLFGESDIDHRADIWALGVVFYEALAGVLPTRQPNVGQIIKLIVTDALVPLRQRAPHLPEPVLMLVERMMQRDRTRRPADLAEVLVVLSQHTDEPFVPVIALPRGEALRSERSAPPVTSPRVMVGSPGVAGAALAYGGSATAPASFFDGGVSPNALGATRTPRPQSRWFVALRVLPFVGLGALILWSNSATRNDVVALPLDVSVPRAPVVPAPVPSASSAKDSPPQEETPAWPAVVVPSAKVSPIGSISGPTRRAVLVVGRAAGSAPPSSSVPAASSSTKPVDPGSYQ